MSDVGDSAMDTGSDAGAPGDHLPDPPLTDDERALLRELTVDDDADTNTGTAVEDSPAAVEAAEDDGPLADLGPGGDAGDPDTDTPDFRPPA